ncbi:hypothetical protein LshimejAT787_0901560 [Lyophyllum shimeji]|uniref:Uncharacterized protein n=1 Tax=Lyophyllum shimeji TaxID=47721 RepID=A0A9P3PSJ0_LYOSH|nr:hypothetical protein LshimejAT787_0901560 [Lyophyllum shimeji]
MPVNKFGGWQVLRCGVSRYVRRQLGNMEYWVDLPFGWEFQSIGALSNLCDDFKWPKSSVFELLRRSIRLQVFAFKPDLVSWAEVSAFKGCNCLLPQLLHTLCELLCSFDCCPPFRLEALAWMTSPIEIKGGVTATPTSRFAGNLRRCEVETLVLISRRPKSFQTRSRNRRAIPSDETEVYVGARRTIFVNRSTITRIASNPALRGRMSPSVVSDASCDFVILSFYLDGNSPDVMWLFVDQGEVIVGELQRPAGLAAVQLARCHEVLKVLVVREDFDWVSGSNQFRSVSFKDWDRKATGRQMPCCLCMSVAPVAYPELSASTRPKVFEGLLFLSPPRPRSMAVVRKSKELLEFMLVTRGRPRCDCLDFCGVHLHSLLRYNYTEIQNLLLLPFTFLWLEEQPVVLEDLQNLSGDFTMFFKGCSVY